jgi:acyl-CoA thioester hydrolase
MRSNSKIKDFKFFTELQVRYEETDSMSVVYYGKYFVFFEVARTEYIKKLGFNYIDIEKNGLYFVVAESNCTYISPARFDDTIRIYTKVEYMKNSSFNFLYLITKINNIDKSETEIVRGYTVLVCVDNTNFKPKRIPEYLREAVNNFEQYAG